MSGARFGEWRMSPIDLSIEGIPMKISVLAVSILALFLGGCRREAPYHEPMKLGALSIGTSVTAATTQDLQ